MKACCRALVTTIVCGAVALMTTACSKDSTPAAPTPTPTCSFSVGQPATTTFGPDGGTGSATVTAAAGCAWTAVSSGAFVTITQGASGSGNGTAQFSVAANPGAARVATLTVAGTTINITQNAVAAGPAPTLSAPSAVSPIGGASLDPGRPTLIVNNATSTGAIGTVTYRFEISDQPTFPNEPVRTFTQDGVAQGSGTTSWVVNHDLGASVLWYWHARATNGTVTGAYSAVETFRTVAPCSAVLSPTSAAVAAGGGTQAVGVTIASTCSWTAVSNDPFITVSAGGSGTGNGTVTLTVAANTGAARAGTVTIAGQTFTVTQSAPASVSNGVVASFQLFDPSAQGGPTTECRFRGPTGSTTTCTLQSTSFTLGTTVIASYAWSVQYTYGAVQDISGTGSSLSFTDFCGKTGSTDDGVAQPLSVTLTVTDSAGATATATASVGSQPALFVRLFSCGF
jgi:hypothetical protein